MCESAGDIVQITKAAPKDFDAVYELMCALENKQLDKKAVRAVYTQNLARPDVQYLLAVADGQIVGFASLHIQQLLHHASPIGELQEIIVHTDKQGLRIGTMLFEAVKALASENHCTQLEICCNQSRIDSHEFYRKRGAKNTHYKFTLPLGV